jgi:hypothetical protein
MPGAGGNSSLVYLLNSTVTTLASNTLANATGGLGASHTVGSGNGSAGGHGIGIFFQNSTATNLSANNITNTTGGIGGAKNGSYTNGTGGNGYGLYFENSNATTFSTNNVTLSYGAAAITGTNPGIPFGVYFLVPSSSNVTNNYACLPGTDGFDFWANSTQALGSGLDNTCRVNLCYQEEANQNLCLENIAGAQNCTNTC